MLPADLAEPLHILPPGEGPNPILWWLLALLALFAFSLWRRWRRMTAAPAASVVPAAEVEPTELERSLEAIRRRALDTGHYRQGCHELAAALREHHEKRKGQPLTRLTAREILALGETAVGNLFARLGDLQFGRRAPERSDFETIVELARAVYAPGTLRRSRSDDEDAGGERR